MSDPNVEASPVQVSYGSYLFEITPFVSRTQEMLYSGRAYRGQITKIRLSGTILVNDGTYEQGFAGLNSKRDALKTAFETDFQSLTVTEKESSGAVTTILQFDHCIVEGVSFDSSGNGISSNYTIDLKCFEKNLFASDYGIMEPSDKTSYVYNEDGTISVEHSVSAVGIFTGNKKPIQNAMNWVDQRNEFAITVDPQPHFATGAFDGSGHPLRSGRFTQENCVLRNQSKNVNRMEGSYSVSKEYILQTGNLWNAPAINATVSKVSTSVSSGVNEDFVTISVNYDLIGSKDSTAEQLRLKAKEITVTGTLYSIATGVDAGFASLLGHNNTGTFPYLPKTVNIDDQADSSSQISISCDFISSAQIITGKGYTFDPSFTVDTDEITSETTVSINGTIKGIGPRGYSYEVASETHNGFAKIRGEYFTLAKDFYYAVLGGPWWWLNPFPTSSSVKENKNKGTIEVSYSFNNKDIRWGGEAYDNLPIAQSADFNMTVNPSMKKYSAKADMTQRGLYAVYDLGVKTRENVEISTTLNHYNEVDSTSSAGFSSDLGLHNHFVQQYVTNYALQNRGVSVATYLWLDESWNIQGTPFNTVSKSSKLNVKLNNRQGTPFNE